MSFLQRVEPLRFIKHARERRAAERAAEREHQLALIHSLTRGFEGMFDSLAQQSKDNSNAMVEIAKSSGAQAEAFGKWLEMFRIAEAPTTSVVREEDEYDAEQRRFAAAGLPADFADLPEEFKLALTLQRDIAESSPA